MNNLFTKIKQALVRFFYGRYGVDKLGYTIVIISLIMSFVSTILASKFFIPSLILQLISYGLLAWALFRVLSKNRQARYRENMMFQNLCKMIKKWFKLQFCKLRDIRTHKYFSCPRCGNNLRLPKGRGEIVITCPVCKTRFDAKT